MPSMTVRVSHPALAVWFMLHIGSNQLGEPVGGLPFFTNKSKLERLVKAEQEVGVLLGPFVEHPQNTKGRVTISSFSS